MIGKEKKYIYEPGGEWLRIQSLESTRDRHGKLRVQIEEEIIDRQQKWKAENGEEQAIRVIDEKRRERVASRKSIELGEPPPPTHYKVGD
jgi:hypothetical protein